MTTAKHEGPASLFTPWAYPMTSAPWSTAPMHMVAFSLYATHGWLNAYREVLDGYRVAMRHQQDAALEAIERYVARGEGAAEMAEPAKAADRTARRT